MLSSGDIEENPEPTALKCPMCNKTVGKNVRRCVCEVCKDVARANCTELVFAKSIRANNLYIWTCPNCISSILPFSTFGTQAFMATITEERSCLPLIESVCGSVNVLEHLNANLNHLKFMHLNTQSMCFTFNEFQLTVENYPLDIITLSETWLKQNPFLMQYVRLPKYVTEFQNRENHRGAAWVCTLKIVYVASAAKILRISSQI